MDEYETPIKLYRLRRHWQYLDAAMDSLDELAVDFPELDMRGAKPGPELLKVLDAIRSRLKELES